MTGPQAQTERLARGLTLREVVPHLGFTAARLHTLEGQDSLTPNMSQRIARAIVAAAEKRAGQDGQGNQLRLARERQGLTLRQVEVALGWASNGHGKKLWHHERRRELSPERTAEILQAIEKAVETRDKTARNHSA